MSFRVGVDKIRSVKVQGATNVAIFGLKLFVSEAEKLKTNNANIFLNKLSKVKTVLINARANEPMLRNVLELFYKSIYDKARVKDLKQRLVSSQKTFLEQLKNDFEKIAFNGADLIKNGDVVFTHCHSSSVMRVFKQASKKTDFSVVCTETRPLFQGRKTAKELVSMGIETKMVVDSHAFSEIKDCNKIFLGADVLSGEGFVNKVGSYNVAYAAKVFKKILYVCSHTLKYSPKIASIEQRSPSEVWKNPPKSLIIENPSFEIIPWKFVKRVVSERSVKKYGGLL
ncbi:MAG: translation initiation factor eIF-2B [Nanoarchaeota archaeon]|nr:translation initiation factor eIF-2B [Nanoarchaeota archaeon]